MSSSATRALQILHAVGGAGRPVGVSEVARQAGVSGGTAFRSLDALERGGYLQRWQASARFVPGPMVQRLRQRLFASFPLREVAVPYLRQLAFASGETTSLTVPLGRYAVRIANAPGTNDVTNSPPLGQVARLDDSAAGLVLLAFRADNPKAPALTEIRARGFAVQAMPFAAERSGLAMPVRGPQGAVAAIAIEGPVLDLQRACYHEDLTRWIQTVSGLEHVIQARPELARNPFDHLDPEAIVLRTTSAA
jgi:DNA-binding IclR family transcriptional regulator